MNIIEDISFGTKNYYKKLIKLSEPLELVLGPITECGIIKISKDKRLSMAISVPGYLDLYLDKKYYNHDPHFAESKNFSSGLAFWFTQSDLDYQNKLIHDGRRFFDMGHGFTYVTKGTDGNCYAYLIASSQFNSHFYNKVINNMYLVKKFIKYIHDEAKPVFNTLDEHSINCEDLKGREALKNQIPIVSQNLNSQNLITYMKAQGLLNQHIKDLQLTNREKECAKLFVKGKTAKETAATLGISPRTVEDHLNSTKYKLRCELKKDMKDILNMIFSKEIV